MIEIPREVVRRIGAHAHAAYPEECCGFLLGVAAEQARIIESRPAKNLATEDRGRRYVIDPLELLRADDDARARALDLIGVYHSHPDHPAEPSEFDRTHAATWYVYLIQGVRKGKPGELRAWRYVEQAERFEAEDLRHAKGDSDGNAPLSRAPRGEP